MKFLVNISIVLLVANVACQQDMMKIVETCKNSVGATDEDLGKIILHAKPENQQQKCMLSCLLTALNIVSIAINL